MHTFLRLFDDPGSFRGFPLCISQCFLVLVIFVGITHPFLHLRRLAAETDEALKEQDERLGKILGKLQVSLTCNCHSVPFSPSCLNSQTN